MDKPHGERVRSTRRKTESEYTLRFTENNTKNISNWKTSSYDGIHRFWTKKFTLIHDRIEINRYLQEAHVPERMTKGKTTLIQKDPPQTTTNL